MSPDASSPGDDPGDVPDETGKRAASSPEDARAAAEDALANVEALADLDDAPSPGPEKTDSSKDPATPTEADPTSTSSSTPEDQCENCGALLHGPYCSQCGQQAADRIVPLWHMVNEALEAVFELDLRVIHTFPKFLFMPGRLTKEYLNGRRKRYIRPFRLYLFATFLLFTVLALSTGGGFSFPFNPSMSSPSADSTQLSAAGDSVTTATGSNPMAAAPAPAFFGSAEQRQEWARQIETDPDAVQVDFGDSETQSRLERLLRDRIAEALRNPGDFIASMIDQGPYVMFLMLPLFAFLLKLLYIRRSRLYVEHLVFSLHVHAFAFFAFTVGILLGDTSVGWLNTAATLIDLSPLLYLVLALRHVYEQGIIKSSIKASFLLFIYTTILLIAFIGLVLTAVILM